ncbi:TetR/AcrR family transcriptional regulator [Ferrimonas sp. SCSIO 43195]|uniref:TetR/AcrR family transcriptional regulator n=1 Tax=Ferrimonas sp. SCSIO 43195 TaxID=2822844 RepID=UPI002075A62C|nr:TetR/AcrR family transcriptional regulator [Ferrimonas sp. SCSIO 43195]USD36634.1 TetR/AcrR family transcriptional regulator [Ferrimonas sp. SCSIO 43195]
MQAMVVFPPAENWRLRCIAGQSLNNRAPGVASINALPNGTAGGVIWQLGHRESQAVKMKPDKDTMLNTAERLIANTGQHYFSMSKLSQELDVSSGYLYRVFPSKEDLLICILIKRLKRLNNIAIYLTEHSSSPKECIVCLNVLLVYFFRVQNKNDGIDFMGVNGFAINKIQEHHLESLSRQFKKLFSLYKTFTLSQIKTGRLLESEANASKLMLRLWMFSRGASMTMSHSFVPSSIISMEGVLEHCIEIAQQFAWHDSEYHRKVEHHEVMTQIRTACDTATFDTD